MNEKVKRSSREDMLEVFRSEGNHDISAENYRLKEQPLSRTTAGPLIKNQITDAPGAPISKPDEPYALTLSGAEAADTAGDSLAATGGTTEKAPQPTQIRLETFHIDMQERLAAMHLAQQKAKDQLNELKQQNPPMDEPLAD